MIRGGQSSLAARITGKSLDRPNPAGYRSLDGRRRGMAPQEIRVAEAGGQIGRQIGRRLGRGSAALAGAIAVNAGLAIALLGLGRFGQAPSAPPCPILVPVEVAWTEETPPEDAKPAPPESPPPEVEPRVAEHAAPTPAPAPEMPAPLPLAVTLDLPDLPPLTVDPAASLEGLDLSALAVRPGPAGAGAGDGKGAAGGPMSERGVDAPPFKTFAPAPNFPRRALRRNVIEGRVEAKLLVDREGRVVRVRILSASPRGYFESAVRRAVTSWTFRPARYRDRAVACWCRQSFQFQVQ